MSGLDVSRGKTWAELFARFLPYKLPSFWGGQFIALLCATGAAALRMSLTPFIGDAIPVVLFYPFILVASVWGARLV